jgi:hypothetical protein
MAVTTTSRNQFAIVTINTESTTWGAYLNTYNFERMDHACGGNLPLTLTTSSYSLNDTVPADETHYDNYDITQTYSIGHSTVVIPNRNGVWNFTIIPYGGSSAYGVRFQVNGTSNYTQYFTNPCNVKLETNSGAITVIHYLPYGGTNEPLGPFYTGSVTTSAQTMYLTFNPAFKSLKPGMLFEFAPGTAASGSAMSVVVDSISGKTLLEATGEALDTLSWASTTDLITCQYNGTNFRKIAPTQAPPIWTTGDCKITLKTVADSGWILANDGTIGNGSSGGTTRANADCANLFTLLWNIDDSICPVSGGRGASAAADFAANKTIAIPKTLGRALGIAGAGSGLTSRALGVSVGAETHTLTGDEIDHLHGIPMASTAGGGGGVLTPVGNTSLQTMNAPTAHNNMQPTTFFNFMIKL